MQYVIYEDWPILVYCIQISRIACIEKVGISGQFSTEDLGMVFSETRNQYNFQNFLKKLLSNFVSIDLGLYLEVSYSE